MIAYLSGKFSHKKPAVVYVDVQVIGYEVNISLSPPSWRVSPPNIPQSQFIHQMC